jgi:hypothetical protein
MQLAEVTMLSSRVRKHTRGRMLRVVVDEPVDLLPPPLQARMRNIVIGAQRRLAQLGLDDKQRGHLIALLCGCVQQREKAH